MSEEETIQESEFVEQDINHWMSPNIFEINTIDKKITGSTNAMVLLGYIKFLATYFPNLCTDEEFVRTNEQLMECTNLTERELRTAKKKLLSLGLISVTKKGLPAKNHYSFNMHRYWVLAQLEFAKTESNNPTN